jgi:hypothetical protein
MTGQPLFDRKPVNEANFEKALKTSEVVIYMGHASGNNSVPYHQDGIQIGDSAYYTSDGKVPTGNMLVGDHLEFGRLGPPGPKPDVSAKVVVNFSCDSSSKGGTYFNFVGKDQVMITINSGEDGLTQAGTLERAF